MTGQTISHYRVLDKLGEGGMGVVYKAEDTKLDRTVALKFLAAHLLNDVEAKERFLREAKAAAALHHPNVCPVYEIDEADAKTFLAMAFLEGEALDARIAKGPLPLKDALDIGRQVAEGLAAAHAKGIVHRDIKPANILVSPEGRATIMDFGLARLTEASKLTRQDQTVGTVAYMSPEQIQGGEVDHRTDIWALGCVLYEMVAGVRPFKGQYDQALAYEIAHEAPEPLTAVRAGLPMELEFIVGKCLAKDASDRYQSANEIAVDLRTLSDKLKSGRSTILRAAPGSRIMGSQVDVSAHSPDDPLVRYRVIEHVDNSADSVEYLAEDTELRRSVKIRVLPQSTAEKVERTRRQRQLIAYGLGAGGVLLAIGLAVAPLFSPPPTVDTPLRRFAFTPPVDVGESDGNNLAVVVSPNGRHIAFTEVGRNGRIWVQDLDQSEPRVIEGTEGAASPFWSPDSEFIGFAVGTELRKIPVQGGLASRICDLPNNHFHGPSWSHDGQVIVFGSGEGNHNLYEVPARGGAPKLLIDSGEIEPSTGQPIGRFYWTHFLPPDAGERVVVFTVRDGDGGAGGGGSDTMALQDLETGRREFLGAGSQPVYSSSGHLVYQPDRAVDIYWAAPFSLDTLEVTGEPFPIVEDSQSITMAADQTMVYLDVVQNEARDQLIWVNRNGEKLGSVGGPQDSLRSPALSPNDRFVAFSARTGDGEDQSRDVWAYDLARGTRTRLSSNPATETSPVWSPSGDQVAFMSNRRQRNEIFVRQSDGSGEEQLFVDTEAYMSVDDWSPDGAQILYRNGRAQDSDLWYLERKGDAGGWEPQPYLEGPFAEIFGQFSPDGRYVAYMSNEAGRLDIYVQPFPGGGRKVTVSTNGGTRPRWSRDGSELFYVEGGGDASTLVAVSVSTSGDFTVGQATPLFSHPRLALGFPSYDVSADGQRFILAEQLAQSEVRQPKIRIVQNWHEEFRDRESPND